MSQLDRLQQALVAADKAGDSGAATALAAEIRRLQAAPKAEAPKIDPMEGIGFGQRALEGAGKAFVDPARAVGQMLGLVPQSEIDEAKRLDAPLMDTAGGFAGNLGANLLTALIPGGNTIKGAALVGGGLSALQPTATGESRLNNTLMGLGLGGGGALAAKGLGRAQTAATNRVAALEEGVKARAAADAAAETASARSAAGRTAQDAYRQVENLRDLKALGLLTPEQEVIYRELSEELARKSAGNLASSAAAKKEAAAAYKEAVETEAERAAKLAAEKLSPKEAKNQLMARIKRYGPGVAGGIAGNMIFPGLGGMVGGAATGLVLRPTVRSAINLAKNPAVQYSLLGPVARSGLLDDLSDPRILGLLAPSIYAAKE